MTKFDLVVIGGGPGGYVAAIRASQLGLSTALVEKEQLGGVCLNWGCIPTKALLRTAEIKALTSHAADYGVNVGPVSVDLKAAVDRSRKISAQLAGGIKHLMKKNKITVFEGHARLKGNSTISITSGASSQDISAPHIILATGASARSLPGIEAEGKMIWTARHAMTPEALPKSLLVIGSGAIGIEFASFYRTLGSEVTVVELQTRILPQEDEEISALAQKEFTKQGMTFLLGTSVEKIKKDKDSVTVTLQGKEQTFDRVILAVGIIGNTADLGLEKTKVKVDRGQIMVDEWSQTHEPGVYAIGDVTGAPWLAHKASHEGIICVEKIAGLPHVRPLNTSHIPGCTYSLPQIASIGFTEAQAKAAGHEIKVGRFPYKANGKAMALGETEGLVKTIFDAKTGALLGAHMIGGEVTELIQGFGIAKTLETTEADLMHTIFPHPTLSEMMHESVLDAYQQAIHF
ncbi:MAG: dihydrolipoamide dehydrogenase [Alphaproteobacteria bacterium]|jgi:dihydrolipoamide dehydrogenase|nr:dihydrolipoamide dehydrogenase [Alphaproteobacteria bacterium]